MSGLIKRNGILTFHYSFNEGAIWQGYCLQKSLSSIGSTEIIDHRYSSKVNYYGNPNLRENSLKLFFENKLNKSPFFSTNNLDEVYSYINLHYKNLIIGSDQVWKLRYKYNNRFPALINIQNHPMYPPFPNIFWPDSRVTSNKILYAGSIGYLNPNSIYYPHRTMMREYLLNFKLIGYRDKATIEFIDWLDPNLKKISEWVPDPTFSYSVISSKIKDTLKLRIFNSDLFRNDKKVIGIISNENEKLNDFLMAIDRDKYILVGLSIKNKMVDIDLSNSPLSPIEWVNVFGLFDFCLTEKMHGAIACILNKIPFLGIGYYENIITGDSTLLDLMTRMDLDDFYCSNKNISKKMLTEKFNKMIYHWPFSSVLSNTAKFQKRLKEFNQKIKSII